MSLLKYQLTPCALTQSIPLLCGSNSGGLKQMKFKTYPSATTISSDFTVTSGVVTVASGSRTGWYTYDLPKETASFTDNPTGSLQNESVFYTPEVKLIVNKLRAAIRNEVEIWGQTDVLIAIRDNNDNYWLFGKETGMRMLSGTIGSGVARSDRSGYDITFQGKESAPKLSMASATYDTLITA